MPLHFFHALRSHVPRCAALRAGAALRPHHRAISSGTTNGVAWHNAHADMPLRPSSHRGMTLTFLGTGSGSPGTGRGMSAALLTLHERGLCLLLDAGEGTQGALQRTAGYSASWLQRGAILVSHLHGDHCFGLPALLSGVLAVRAAREAERRGDMAERSGRAARAGQAAPLPLPPLPKLRVFGPPGLHRYLDAAWRSVQQLEGAAYVHQLPVEVIELYGPEGGGSSGGGGSGGGSGRGGGAHRGAPLPPSALVPLPPGPPILARRVLRPDARGIYTCLTEEHLVVQAAPLLHTVPTLAYVVREAGGWNLDAGLLAAAGIVPSRATRHAMVELKAGRTALNVPLAGGGVLAAVTPQEVSVAGGSKRGVRSVALFSDCSAPTPAALECAAGCDLLVHEATLGPGEEDKARSRGHATPIIAGATAGALRARSLVLTHFGRAHLEPEGVSSMWSLGLKEALEEARRRGSAGGSAAGSAGGPRHRVHTRWAGTFSHVSAGLESPEMQRSGAPAGSAAAAPAPAAAAAAPGEEEDLAFGEEEAAGTAKVDFAFPPVQDAPEPQAFAEAAAAAYERALGPAREAGQPPRAPLPVLCARDFLRVIVQPEGGRRWGACGPLDEGKGGGAGGSASSSSGGSSSGSGLSSPSSSGAGVSMSTGGWREGSTARNRR